jgi:hypothetical protein
VSSNAPTNRPHGQITCGQDLYNFLAVLDAEMFPIVSSEGNKITITVDYTGQRVIMTETSTLLEK